MSVVTQEYIEINERGVAKLIGLKTKVSWIVGNIEQGMTPQQIHKEFPHLSLAQVHAALAYYYDHTEAIEQERAESLAAYEEARKLFPPQFTKEQLLARWKEKYGTDYPEKDSHAS